MGGKEVLRDDRGRLERHAYDMTCNRKGWVGCVMDRKGWVGHGHLFMITLIGT